MRQEFRQRLRPRSKPRLRQKLCRLKAFIRMPVCQYPPGATSDQVALGKKIFHGEVAGATCAGCHGADGIGTPVGADLTFGTWLWGDGSLQSITDTIKTGVPTPKQHAGTMPPLGGVALSNNDVAAVAAYVWAIGHQKKG